MLMATMVIKATTTSAEIKQKKKMLLTYMYSSFRAISLSLLLVSHFFVFFFRRPAVDVSLFLACTLCVCVLWLFVFSFSWKSNKPNECLFVCWILFFDDVVSLLLLLPFLVWQSDKQTNKQTFLPILQHLFLGNRVDFEKNTFKRREQRE